MVRYKGMLAHYYLWDLVAKRVIVATNMEFNEAKALVADKKSTNDIGSPLELDLEAYIE